MVELFLIWSETEAGRLGRLQLALATAPSEPFLGLGILEKAEHRG